MTIKSRPGFEVSVERTAKSTEHQSVFLDIKRPGQVVDLRFTPTSLESGALFFKSAQHYKFKEGGEKRAWACLNLHGTEKCPICELLDNAAAKDVLAGNDKFSKGLGFDAYGSVQYSVSYRWHAQVIPLPREGQGAPEQTFIIGLSKTTADKVTDILKMQRDNRQPLLTDPDKGQAVRISRGEGTQVRYTVQNTGMTIPLDDLLPGWEEKFLDVERAQNLRIGSREQLLGSIEETIGKPLFQALLG